MCMQNMHEYSQFRLCNLDSLLGGKVLREGMGQMSQCHCDLALDTVITNAVILDAVQGIVKVGDIHKLNETLVHDPCDI